VFDEGATDAPLAAVLSHGNAHELAFGGLHEQTARAHQPAVFFCYHENMPLGDIELPDIVQIGVVRRVQIGEVFTQPGQNEVAHGLLVRRCERPDDDAHQCTHASARRRLLT